MTETLERRLLRRSLDNHLDSPLDDRRRRSSPRHSLTGNHNKENFGVHFVRHSFGNTSLSALQDLSNGKSPRRPQEETPPEDITPLARLKFRNKIKEDSLSSSRMGDVTLDRMLDAIIESARKDVKTVEPPRTPEAEPKDVDKDESIHEMEVRTPQHLKRQRVVRRKNPKTTDKKANKEKAKERRVQEMKKEGEGQTSPPHTLRSQSRHEMIGLTLPNGIPSPETPEAVQHYANHKSLLNMTTPPPASERQEQQMLFEVGNSVAVHCSTPTLALEGHSIKRCLSFSCASEEDAEEGSYSKRGSITSSIASSTNEQLSGSCSSSSNSLSNVAGGAGVGRGSLDVAIYLDNETLNVHVIRCRDLQRPNGSTSSNNLNAYVKVALIRQSQSQNQCYQRTVVHRHSNRPYFDHCFKFDLSDLAAAVEEINPDDRLQMSVWHRDRQHK
ncbi:uncharacterized protein LOC133331339 [Musca vetustissima]|uniref:uncharacterized protein LOC133331339 n=1 Tax=Musca vetustissima TaxID=27455 RepID=UPI002AB67D2F|nr:uncharacterized protein LOC133331339 [Musca vetustissima]